MNVVLLRGINVGGKHKLPMAELRMMITDLGGRNVATYIQSGNAVADGVIDADELTDAIEQRYGFRPSVLVLDAERFEAVVDACPFDLSAGAATHIFFSLGTLAFDLDAALGLATNTEQIEATTDAVYLHLPDGMGRSQLAQRLDRLADTQLTGRNANTVNKLTELLASR